MTKESQYIDFETKWQRLKCEIENIPYNERNVKRIRVIHFITVEMNMDLDDFKMLHSLLGDIIETKEKHTSIVGSVDENSIRCTAEPEKHYIDSSPSLVKTALKYM